MTKVCQSRMLLAILFLIAIFPSSSLGSIIAIPDSLILREGHMETFLLRVEEWSEGPTNFWISAVPLSDAPGCPQMTITPKSSVGRFTHKCNNFR